MKYLELNDISCYKKSFELSNLLWKDIIVLPYFAKNTLGIQLIRAADSISANIAEGFGRYGKKDKIKFYYYSLGSVRESQDWLLKAKYRGLISKEKYEVFNLTLEVLPREIHQLIKFTELKLRD